MHYFNCHDEFDFARQAVKLNCLDYILKPVRYDFLTEVLQKAKETVKKKEHSAVLEDYGKKYIESVAQQKKGRDTRCGGTGGKVY